MPLRVDVCQHSHKEGRGVPLGEELPAAGLAELQERAGTALRGAALPLAPRITLAEGAANFGGMDDGKANHWLPTPTGTGSWGRGV